MHFFSNEEKQYVGVQKNDFGHALHAVRFPPPPPGEIPGVAPDPRFKASY